jgi:ubiquinone/menaquinone biosynthesis C-methylase UbiE
MEEKRFNPEKLARLNDPVRSGEFPVKRIIELTGIENPDVIIDLGAGTAFFSVPFARLYRSCKIYACDISEIMVDWIRKNIAPQYDNIHPMRINDNQVPLDDRTADFVFMVNLHHELDSPEDTLIECHRLLKPEGAIAISDYRKEHTEKGPSFELRYEPGQVKDQLKRSGFHKIKVYLDFPNNFLVIAKKPKDHHPG